MRTTDLRFKPETCDFFRQALQVMSCAYSSHNLTFPLSTLRALLLYKTNEQVESDCRQYSILVKDNAISFWKGAFQPDTHVSSVHTIWGLHKHVMTTRFYCTCVCPSLYPLIYGSIQMSMWSCLLKHYDGHSHMVILRAFQKKISI